MTGAGASQAVFVKNTGWDTLPGSPTYYRPGRNITVENLSLQNTLQRLRTPSNAEAVDSIAGNFQGAFGISYVMSNDTHDDIRDIVFNDSGTGFTTGLAPLSTWYVGSKYLDTSHTENTVERVLENVIPLEYAITYTQGTNTVRETLTMAYANEDTLNTAFTPSSVTGPADSNDVPFHGTDLTINAATVNRLQSCTLRFAGPLYRYHRDTSRYPSSAVLANPQTTLEASAIYHSNDYLGLAYGGATSDTSPQDQFSNVSGSLAFDVGGSTVATYTLSKLKPDQYDWNDLVNADADLQGPTTYHVNGGISIA